MSPDSRQIWRRHPRAVAVVLAVLWFALAWYQTSEQARLQQPNGLTDSVVYLETAAQPLALDQLFYPKPFTVPALYHLFDADPARIAPFQLRFAIIAWTLFGFALCATLRRTRARIAACAVAFMFLLAPTRVGFTSVMLSESIADSLAILLVAEVLALSLALRLAPSARRTAAIWTLTSVLALSAIAWLLTRDTHSLSMLVAVPLAAVLLRLHRRWREARSASVLAAIMIVVSAFAMWTARVGPSSPTNLKVHSVSGPEMMPRSVYPTVNNVFRRVLPNPNARAFFIARGLPQADELAKLDWGGQDLRFLGPELAPARYWIVEHGASVYMKWLVSRPVANADEFVRHLWDALAPELTGYMPPGWIRAWGFPYWLPRKLTDNAAVLLILIVLLPLAVRRTRAHVVTIIALVLVAAGFVGAAAAYFADAFEVGRHMYGAGQLMVLGLFLAPLAWLDLPNRRPA